MHYHIFIINVIWFPERFENFDSNLGFFLPRLIWITFCINLCLLNIRKSSFTCIIDCSCGNFIIWMHLKYSFASNTFSLIQYSSSSLMNYLILEPYIIMMEDILSEK